MTWRNRAQRCVLTLLCGADDMPGQRTPRGTLRGTLAERVVLMSLMVAMLSATAIGNDSAVLQRATDLREEAAQSRAHRLVMVLEFSREDCAYCRKLEALFLLPMQRNADYAERILLRSIALDDSTTVIDFAGRSIPTSEFAARYGVSMTPTLLFLNADGSEISERLVGIWSEDYYGWFIDSRIDEARKRL